MQGVGANRMAEEKAVEAREHVASRRTHTMTVIFEMKRSLIILFFACALLGCSKSPPYTIHFGNESTQTIRNITLEMNGKPYSIAPLDREHFDAVTNLRPPMPDRLLLSWTAADGAPCVATLRVPAEVKGLEHYVVQFADDGKTVNGLYVLQPKDTGFTSENTIQQSFDIAEVKRKTMAP